MNKETIDHIKKISNDNRIPYIRDNTIKFICEYIKNRKYSSYLEIGSAYGYSACCIAILDEIKEVDSIEKNEGNYQFCISNIKDEKINFINYDAFEFNPNKKYDVILVDGPKSHQETLVEKYIKFLNPNGVMFIDNLYLKKFDSRKTLTKDQAKLIEKVKKFHSWLINNKSFQFEEMKIDDGLGIVKLNQ